MPRARVVVAWSFAFAVAGAAHAPFFRPSPASPTAARPRGPREEAEHILRTSRQRNVDYAGFFLRAEGRERGRDPAPALARFGLLADAIRREDLLPGPKQLESNVLRALSRLFRELHLDSYRLKESRMSGYFDEDDPGGNCEAQTKLVIAILAAVRPALPAGTMPGVEIFSEHVSPVLYDRHKGEVWSLLTGERTRVRAPVFAPPILVSAYLRGLGRRPPVDDRELLLAAPPGSLGGPTHVAFQTNSRSRFPSSTVRYAAGEAPDRATMPFPLPAQDRPAHGAAAPPPTVTRDSFVERQDALYLFGMDQAHAPFGVARGALVFATHDAKARYDALSTDRERRALLLDLTEAAILRELGSGPARDAAESLASADRRADKRGALLANELAVVSRVERLIGQCEAVLREVFGDGAGTTMVASVLETRIPQLGALRGAVRSFERTVGRDPLALLRELARYEPSQRDAFLSFLSPRLPPSHARALAAALADPRRTALVAGGAPPRASTEPVAWMEIELLELPPASDAPPAPSSAEAPAPLDPPSTAEPVPVTVFVDVVLSGLLTLTSAGDAGRSDVDALVARWDERVTQLFLSELPTGRHDVCRRLAQVETQLADRPRAAHLERLRARLSTACGR
ncbi:MAG: hypothetical protein IT374_12705 [Polyangiaceae bacterium]|nr:hypothetical protein [Polyangiaceae bacterium]